MTPITTLSALLPCPTCGVIGPRTVALQAPSPASELIESGSLAGLSAGARLGVVSECSACWTRRADLIAVARHRLQATGELSSLGPGREDAWLGVPLSRCEEAFENAFASALLKAPNAAALPAPPRPERLEIAVLSKKTPEPEPELVWT